MYEIVGSALDSELAYRRERLEAAAGATPVTHPHGRGGRWVRRTTKAHKSTPSAA